MLAFTVLLTAVVVTTANTTSPHPEPSRPCRPPRPTSPSKPPIRFFRSSSSLSSVESTTFAAASMVSTDASPLRFATHQHANHTTINSQCQADYVQVLLLLTVVIGIPIAVYICTTAIRSATHLPYEANRTPAKPMSFSTAAETAEITFDAESTFAAAENTSGTEAFAITTASSLQEYADLTTDEAATAKLVTFQPYVLSEPPSPYSSRRSQEQRLMTRGRPSTSGLHRGQRAASPYPIPKTHAKLRPSAGSPPVTTRRFAYERRQKHTRSRPQPRRPGRSRPPRPPPSLPFRPGQLALTFYIVLTCAVTCSDATDPAATPTTSIFTGTGNVLYTILILLITIFGTPSLDSAHGNTPPTEATEVNQFQQSEANPDQISPFDFSLEVPLPTPPPPSPPSSPPTTSPPSPTNTVPEAETSTPNFASILSRYPTDTSVFVIYSVYVIVFETTTSKPYWIRAASRYSKTRLINAIREASRRHEAVLVINSDLTENTAVSTGRLLRQLKSVTELLLPNNLPFLLQANAFALISLRSAFPTAVRTATVAANDIKPTASHQTHEDALYSALQAVLSAPILEGYSNEDVATSLSRRASSHATN